MRIRMHWLIFFVLFSAKTALARENGWKHYAPMDKFIFFLDHPPESRIVEKKDKAFNYVRIEQNKNPSKVHQMKEGEFLLEIFEVPKSSWGPKQGWPDCAQANSAKPTVLDDRTAWRSEAVDDEGLVLSVCMQNFEEGRMYVVNATWPTTQREEALEVLKTFGHWHHAF